MANIVDTLFNTAIGSIALTLGEIELGHLEVPETINGGGRQMLAVHKKVGGARRVDSLGRDDADITWSGLFLGTTAEFRCKYLDGVRAAGEMIPLTYSFNSYEVVVRDFTWHFEMQWQIHYTISVVVVKDLSIPIPVILPAGYLDALIADEDRVFELLLLIEDGSLTAAFEAAVGIINSIQNLTGITDAERAISIKSLQNVLNIAGGLTGQYNKALFP